jgi:hypothetical protein
MQRYALTIAAGTLVLGSLPALAQSGDLAGVTMRVLDDLRDVETVVLSLDATPEATDAPAAGADRARESQSAEPSRDAARDEAAADDARRAERRERDALHDRNVDERGDGRLDDRDVERSTAPPPAAAP